MENQMKMCQTIEVQGAVRPQVPQVLPLLFCMHPMHSHYKRCSQEYQDDNQRSFGTGSTSESGFTMCLGS